MNPISRIKSALRRAEPDSLYWEPDYIEAEQHHQDAAMRLVRTRLMTYKGTTAEVPGDVAIALADMVVHYARFYVDFVSLQVDGTIWSESPEYNPDDFDAVVQVRLDDYAMVQREGRLKRWRS